MVYWIFALIFLLFCLLDAKLHRGKIEFLENLKEKALESGHDFEDLDDDFLYNITLIIIVTASFFWPLALIYMIYTKLFRHV